MKKLALLLALVPSVALAGRSYNADKKVTHDCAEEADVNINVADAEFTFTGTCDKIVVNGAGNTVRIEKVKRLLVNGASNTIAVQGTDRITVNGNDNKITYKSKVAGKGKPRVSSNGRGNKIARK